MIENPKGDQSNNLHPRQISIIFYPHFEIMRRKLVLFHTVPVASMYAMPPRNLENNDYHINIIMGGRVFQCQIHWNLRQCVFITLIIMLMQT